jgi:hypothetical protein
MLIIQALRRLRQEDHKLKTWPRLHETISKRGKIRKGIAKKSVQPK